MWIIVLFQNGQSYSYMLLHTEDLVDDRIPVKFGAIKQLAVWVNSDASDDYICCLAVKGSSFMGSHDRTSREDIKSASQSAMQLKQRYGKWRAQTSKNPKLASDLHEVGRQGLEILGYEPLRNFADDSTAWGDSKYQCTLTPADCGIKEPILEKSNGCTYQESTDFRAGSLRIDLSMTSATSAGDCCADCRGKEHCQHFSFDIRNNYCYLKSGTGNIVSGQEASGLISGSLI